MTPKDEIENLAGQAVTDLTRIDGCDATEFFKAVLADGSVVTAKLSPLAQTEARMMRQIGQFALAPQPRFVNDRVLIRDFVEVEAGSPAHWRSFGLSVRRLHAQTGDHYGWEENFASRSVPVLNTPCDD